MRTAAQLLPLFVLALTAPQLAGQAFQPERRFAAVRLHPGTGLAAEVADSTDPDIRTAVLASLLLPGAGQKLQGTPRWPVYLGFEIVNWVRYIDRRGDGNGFQDDYRDLAWEVARDMTAGPRRDGDFEYYETMADFQASGAFDAEPALDGIQPETDAATFNGQAWQLAREIYFPAGATPEPGTAPYQQALQYYLDRAITPEFAWSWRGAAAEQELFRDLIRESDEAFRDATLHLGLILANHLASGIDALITGRSRSAVGRDAAPVRIHSSLDRRGGRLRWHAGLRIGWQPR